ncbi:MAG TPA: hypothetical protein VK428_11885 [Acidimicrobiales bacterium]|nr:hypothetical protein [Acidimicrobiales bacterium]
MRGRTRLRFRRAGGAFILLAFLASITVAACSSPAENSGLKLPTRSTTDPTAAVQAAVLAAWKAAETAFYQAEANPTGLFSPSLPATMTDPQLEMVKTNLAGQESEDFLGQGPWNLGSPRVVSLGPTENDPTTATVVSCIHDTQILVNENTGQPASGLNGTPDWAGATSTMVLVQGMWKLSQQSSVANTNRQVACAGIS